MNLYSKYSYTKYPRKQITTTINTDLHKQFQQLALEIGEPTSKMWDILLMDLFSNEQLILNFVQSVKKYK